MTVERGLMADALTEALKTAPTLPRDGAAVTLAKRYAELIDDSALPSKYRAALRMVRSALPPDPRLIDAYDKIADALAEHTVASDLGPKLLAALTALGMTAAGRSAKGGPADGPRVPDELAALRDNAARRRSR